MDSSAKRKHLNMSVSRESQHVMCMRYRCTCFLPLQIKLNQTPSIVSALGGHSVVLPNPRTPPPPPVWAWFEEEQENYTELPTLFKGSVERSRHKRHFCSLLPYFLLSWLQIFQLCLSFCTSSPDLVLFKKFFQEKEKYPKNYPKRLCS